MIPQMPKQRIINFGPDYKLSIVDEQNKPDRFALAVFYKDRIVEISILKILPNGKKVLILSFEGFTLVNFIYFSLIAIFLLYQFINIDIDMLRDK